LRRVPHHPWRSRRARPRRPIARGVASRAGIAGRLANTPENLIRWIDAPQSFSPGSVMPDMGVTEADARDTAAYLYTLK